MRSAQSPFTYSRVLTLRISESSDPRPWEWGQYLQIDTEVVFLCDISVVVYLMAASSPRIALAWD